MTLKELIGFAGLLVGVAAGSVGWWIFIFGDRSKSTPWLVASIYFTHQWKIFV